MKGSLTSASAIIQGLNGWVSRGHSAATGSSEPEVVSACGLTEVSETDTRREFAEERDRWPLGPSVDNYS